MHEDYDCNQNPGFHLSPSSQSMGLSGLEDTRSSEFISPLVSPSCSIEEIQELNKRLFHEFVFLGLPMIADPIIILRLLAHKMFGNMIKRKTLYSESKLKPPKLDNLFHVDMCPPRSDSESAKEDSREPLSKRRRANLHVSISDDSGEQSSAAKATHVAGDVDYCRHNGIQPKNGTTKLALKAIGESLVTPLDLNITSPRNEIECSTALNSPEPSADSKGSTAKTRLFRWPSKKRLSKSHANVSSAHRDSIVSQSSVSDQKDMSSPLTPEIDIAAFQRELINLPTFVMDTPATDVSPVFSRSSSVPENLACRTNASESLLGQGSQVGSQKQLSKSEFSSEAAVTRLVNSVVTITTTDMDVPIQPSLVYTQGDRSSDTALESMTNIVVHFEAPASPLASSASQSPQGFEFPPPPQPSTLSVTQKLTEKTASAQPSATTSTPPATSNSQACETSTKSGAFLWSPTQTAKETTVANTNAEISTHHCGVLKVIETWVKVCKNDFESSTPVVHEMREFLRKLSVLGHEYKIWCQRIGGLLHLEVMFLFNSMVQTQSQIISFFFPACQKI